MKGDFQMKNSGKDTSEIKNENQEIKKNKITKYLEQNKIRFERIISLMITIITVFLIRLMHQNLVDRIWLHLKNYTI